MEFLRVYNQQKIFLKMFTRVGYRQSRISLMLGTCIMLLEEVTEYCLDLNCDMVPPSD